MLRSRTTPGRRSTAALLLTAAAVVATPIMLISTASAAIVATVPLATSAEYSVLGGSAVTNTGLSVLDASLGVSPGTSITGFPPGVVTAPGTTNQDNAAAAAAQGDLTTAYNNAAGRPVDATTPADLADLILQPGVYAGPSKSALGLSGPLVLDGGGDPTAVFIFQTDSTLTTASGSTVSLINGAQECNVFWQVGSSATLGTGSTFTGNILALTSITVTTGVTVHGRALARNGAVTLDTDRFTSPTCDLTTGGTTTTTGGSGTPGSEDGAGDGSGGPGDLSLTGTDTPDTDLTSGGSGVPGIVGPPKTDGGPSRSGSFPWPTAWLGGAALLAGSSVMLSRRSDRRADVAEV